MDLWKEKVLPKIHKFLWKDGTKKAAAAEEACKSFDESKGAINKELEEKKGELKPKVIEIFEASSNEIKSLVKEPKGPGLKKHSVKVQKFLAELVQIDFPGSKAAFEATSKYGPTLAPSPVLFVFEKVSTFIATDEVATKEAEALPPPPPTSAEATTKELPSTTAETREIIVKEVAVKESKKTDAPSETAKEPLKVEEKKEEPLKA